MEGPETFWDDTDESVCESDFERVDMTNQPNYPDDQPRKSLPSGNGSRLLSECQQRQRTTRKGQACMVLPLRSARRNFKTHATSSTGCSRTLQTNLHRAQEAARDIHSKLDETTTYNVAHINKFIAVLILLGMHKLPSDSLALGGDTFAIPAVRNILVVGVPSASSEWCTSTTTPGSERPVPQVLPASGYITALRRPPRAR